MTQDEIIEIANQAGIYYRKFEEQFANANTDGVEMESMIAFAKMIAKKQAEKCEFLCEELWRKGGWEHNAGFAATCIRKRFLDDDSKI